MENYKSFTIATAILIAAIIASGTVFADSDANLVAYYPFSGNANDESGNGNDGIVFGATLCDDRYSNANSAYYFGGVGVGDYVDMGMPSSLRITGALTATAWFLAEPGQWGINPPTVVSRYGRDAHYNRCWRLSLSDEGKPQACVSETGWAEVQLTGSSVVSTNIWHHLAMTYEPGTSLRVYLDGILAAETTSSIPGSINNPEDVSVYVGAFWWYGEYPGALFKGMIDEVRIYNRALTESEIKILASNLLVTTPNGGESWMAGTTEDIQWEICGDANIAEVKIEYSDSNGQSWNLIDSNATNDGEYDWLIPEVTSNQCLVRISDANDPNIYDISDDVFTIFECLGPIPGDLNNDCYNNGKDLAILAAHWLRCGNPLDPACGIVAYYPFSGNANDKSGNGNHGSPIGGVTWTSGVLGSGIHLDGSGYINVPDSPSLDLPGARGTISAFIKIDPSSDEFGIVSKESSSSFPSTIAYKFNVRYSGTIEGFGISDGTTTNYVGYNGTSLKDSLWHHVAVTWSGLGGELVLYRDGVQVDQTDQTISTINNISEPVHIGAFRWNVSGIYRYMTGDMDEVRIYNRALTSTEVLNLYNAQ